jgi:hypothetical protein
MNDQDRGPVSTPTYPTGTCDGGDCNRPAVSMAYDDHLDQLIPVCLRHILAYRISSGLWQAEDEWIGLRFCRRSRWRVIAQAKILHDQLQWVWFGVPSRAQVRLTRRAVAADEARAQGQR